MAHFLFQFCGIINIPQLFRSVPFRSVPEIKHYLQGGVTCTDDDHFRRCDTPDKVIWPTVPDAFPVSFSSCTCCLCMLFLTVGGTLLITAINESRWEHKPVDIGPCHT